MFGPGLLNAIFGEWAPLAFIVLILTLVILSAIFGKRDKEDKTDKQD